MRKDLKVAQEQMRERQRELRDSKLPQKRAVEKARRRLASLIRSAALQLHHNRSCKVNFFQEEIGNELKVFTDASPPGDATFHFSNEGRLSATLVIRGDQSTELHYSCPTFLLKIDHPRRTCWVEEKTNREYTWTELENVIRRFLGHLWPLRHGRNVLRFGS